VDGIFSYFGCGCEYTRTARQVQVTGNVALPRNKRAKGLPMRFADQRLSTSGDYDEHLAQTAVSVPRGQVVKLVETQIALVETSEGIAAIPAFGLLACRNCKVTMSALIEPVAEPEFRSDHQSRRRPVRRSRILAVS
jgi:hypothetical protein